MVSCAGELFRRAVGDETIGIKMQAISIIVKPADGTGRKVPQKGEEFP
jgi:hypothetical protein